MKRFRVTVPYGTMYLFHSSEETLRKEWPEATDVEEVEKDKEAIEICKALKERATEVVQKYGREAWVLPSPVGKIYFYPLVDSDDGEFFDACEYQVESFGLIEPVLRTLVSVKRFWELFNRELERKEPFLLDVKEIKKAKAKKAKDIDGYRVYTDGNGDFYIVNKSTMPTKKQVDEFKEYGGTESVFVRFGSIPNWEYGWFDSFEEFKSFFENFKRDSDPAFATPTYQIIKKGSDLKDPNHRKCFVYLGKPPLFQDTKERNARNWAASLSHIASGWRGIIPTLEKIM